jgi:hypothetical protein
MKMMATIRITPPTTQIAMVPFSNADKPEPVLVDWPTARSRINTNWQRSGKLNRRRKGFYRLEVVRHKCGIIILPIAMEGRTYGCHGLFHQDHNCIGTSCAWPGWWTSFGRYFDQYLMLRGSRCWVGRGIRLGKSREAPRSLYHRWKYTLERLLKNLNKIARRGKAESGRTIASIGSHIPRKHSLVDQSRTLVVSWVGEPSNIEHSIELILSNARYKLNLI